MSINAVKRFLNFTTHRIFNLPVLVIMPHSRCNCRCVMCDIWKANNDKKEISSETLARHIQSFKKLGVREIVFSGGEALMHSNLWAFAAQLKAEKIRLTLLSTGLLLKHNAHAIVKHVDAVIVSLDGSASIHNAIRQVPNAFEKLAEGVKSLKDINATFRVTGRCVLQRLNYVDFPNIVRAARAIGLDSISFLGADVSSGAFNRAEAWNGKQPSEVVLTESEAEHFQQIVAASFVDFRKEYAGHFIAESPLKMQKLVQYYKALHGKAAFPSVVCNAPWISAVIESDGRVMPCFFHKPYGNIHDEDFESVINSNAAVAFRKSLNMKDDPICKKCVCSLKLGIREMN